MPGLVAGRRGRGRGWRHRVPPDGRNLAARSGRAGAVESLLGPAPRTLGPEGRW